MRIAVLTVLVGCADVAESPRATTLGIDECDDVSAADGWRTDFLPQSTGRSEYLFTATPLEDSGNPIDAVVGFSNGRADSFSDLGPILRFNAQGFVDARSGSGYQAVSSFVYRPGTTYDVVIDPDVGTHTYDAFIQETASGHYTQIANDFPFRTEQASIVRLDNIGRKIDSSTGTLRICRFYPAIFDDFLSSFPGAGWSGAEFAPQRGRFRAEVNAEADSVAGGAPNNTDGVIGLSRAMPA